MEDVSGTSRDAGNRGSCIGHAVLVFSLLNAVSTKASTMASRPFCVMSLRMVLSFLSAVCACRPSRNCVPSARPRACQGRQPRRGWSEAKSLYRVAASRRLAVVMAGFVPFVSFRSVDPSTAKRAGARGRHAAVTQPRPHVRKRTPEKLNRFSGGRRSGVVFPRRALHPRYLSSPEGTVSA